MTDKNEALTEIIRPAVESFGLQLWGLQYLPQKGNGILRVFIDSEKGVEIDDCAKVSRQLGSLLDVEDPIDGKYTLEVSSPGLDRPLMTFEHFQQYVGQRVKVQLIRAIKTEIGKRRKYTAKLLSADESTQILKLECDEEQVDIEFLNVDKAKLLVEF